MNKCSPVEMKKALETVDAFKEAGIRFVPMPVFDDDDHKRTVIEMIGKLSVSAENQTNASHSN